MNILEELLSWYCSKGDEYRERTLLVDAVNDFLTNKSKSKIVFKCESISDVKENIVSILGMMGNPSLKTREDLDEIDNAAFEVYEYLSSQFKVEADSREWISVEERLPEEEQIVLSFGNGERPSVSIYQSGRFDRWVDIVNGDRCMSVYYDSIRFWQPLPSPPLTVPDKQK